MMNLSSELMIKSLWKSDSFSAIDKSKAVLSRVISDALFSVKVSYNAS
jgi:hypothetical protein